MNTFLIEKQELFSANCVVFIKKIKRSPLVELLRLHNFDFTPAIDSLSRAK